MSYIDIDLILNDIPQYLQVSPPAARGGSQRRGKRRFTLFLFSAIWSVFKWKCNSMRREKPRQLFIINWKANQWEVLFSNCQQFPALYNTVRLSLREFRRSIQFQLSVHLYLVSPQACRKVAPVFVIFWPTESPLLLPPIIRRAALQIFNSDRLISF